MTSLRELTKHFREQVGLYPHLADELQDIIELAYSEVDEGGSEPHEVSLAYSDIEDLIKISKNEL